MYSEGVNPWGFHIYFFLFSDKWMFVVIPVLTYIQWFVSDLPKKEKKNRKNRIENMQRGLNFKGKGDSMMWKNLCNFSFLRLWHRSLLYKYWEHISDKCHRLHTLSLVWESLLLLLNFLWIFHFSFNVILIYKRNQWPSR